MSWRLGLAGYESVIPAPAGFEIATKEIAQEGRTVSGRLVKDIVATKRVFSLDFKALIPSDVQILLTEYGRKQPLTFIYPDQGEDQTAIVWFTDFSREKVLAGEEYWDIGVGLEEQ